jgi:hypothetical protein
MQAHVIGRPKGFDRWCDMLKQPCWVGGGGVAGLHGELQHDENDQKLQDRLLRGFWAPNLLQYDRGTDSWSPAHWRAQALPHITHCAFYMHRPTQTPSYVGGW